MAYKFKTSLKRSCLMKKIRSENTTPEIFLQKALRKQGLKFKKNCKTITGNPDIVLCNKKIVIFVDGEFWHGYKWKEKREKIKANRDYWIPKIERNIARDKLNAKILRKEGWQVIRFWEHQLKKNLIQCMQKIIKATA